MKTINFLIYETDMTITLTVTLEDEVITMFIDPETNEEYCMDEDELLYKKEKMEEIGRAYYDCDKEIIVEELVEMVGNSVLTYNELSEIKKLLNGMINGKK